MKLQFQQTRLRRGFSRLSRAGPYILTDGMASLCDTDTVIKPWNTHHQVHDSRGPAPFALARPAAAPGEVTRRSAWRSEFALWRKARRRAIILLKLKDRSQTAMAVWKRDPGARRAAAG